ASSLNNLGNQLSNLGRHEEALTATTEAIAILERLNSQAPRIFEQSLKATMILSAARLDGLGRGTEAAEMRRRAEAI
ncbi:tetratricopeptide repeat protein, partial [Micromonospora arborensis]|uniref:tetratricopeptide repeat protein n=1 Tax=Micromonospora arborensis TaxID=2116518 RepID=UPI0033FDF5BA